MHANFVENLGAASTGEVIELIARARSLVLECHGVALEPEVQVLGDVRFPWSQPDRAVGDRGASAKHATVGRALKPICAAAALAAALTIGLLSRDPSLFRVERLQIVGLPAHSDPALAASITRVARGMSVAGATAGPFERTLERYTLIRRVELRATLPHTLVVKLVERAPVALLDVGGRHTPLAADGTLVSGLTAVPREPPILATRSPAAAHGLDAGARAELTVLDAAPAALRARLLSLRTTAEGIVAHLAHGRRCTSAMHRCRTRNGTRPPRCSPTLLARGELYRRATAVTAGRPGGRSGDDRGRLRDGRRRRRRRLSGNAAGQFRHTG